MVEPQDNAIPSGKHGNLSRRYIGAVFEASRTSFQKVYLADPAVVLVPTMASCMVDSSCQLELPEIFPKVRVQRTVFRRSMISGQHG